MFRIGNFIASYLYGVTELVQALLDHVRLYQGRLQSNPKH